MLRFHHVQRQPIYLRLSAMHAPVLTRLQPFVINLMWLVAGRVGFGYDMGAVSEAAGEGAGKIANVLEITDAAAAEVEKRWGEPYRVWQFWKKVLPICHFKCTIS